jgi:hypothetical protein
MVPRADLNPPENPHHDGVSSRDEHAGFQANVYVYVDIDEL